MSTGNVEPEPAPGGYQYHKYGRSRVVEEGGKATNSINSVDVAHKYTVGRIVEWIALLASWPLLHRPQPTVCPRVSVGAPFPVSPNTQALRNGRPLEPNRYNSQVSEGYNIF